MSQRNIFYTLIALPAFFTLLALRSGPIFAEQALSFEQAKERVLASSTALQQAEIAVRTALNRENIALSSFFPSLSASFSLDGSAADLIGGNAEAGTLEPNIGLSATQTLYANGSRYFALKKASAATRAKLANLQTRRLEILHEFEAAWYSALEAEDNLEAALKERQAAQKSYELALQKEKMGILPHSDTLQAQANLLSSENGELRANFALKKELKNIENLVKLEFTRLERKEITHEDALAQYLMENIDNLNDIAGQLLSIASENDSSILASRIALEEADYAVIEDALSYLPLSARLSFSLNNSEASLLERTRFSISASLPIFPLRSRIKSSQSITYSKDLARLNLRTAKENLEASLLQNLYDIVSFKSQIASSALSVEIAMEAYKLVFERWNMGLINWQELETAQQRLFNAEKSQRANNYKLITLLNNLKSTTGLETSNKILDYLIALHP